MANATTRYASNQQYLARVSSQTGMRFHVKSPTQADRLVRGFRAQEAKGLPLSRQAARGHRVTPEHGPRGARPRLPAPVVRYGPPPRSKYTNRTAPLRHKRPLGIRRKVNFDQGVVYTVKSEAEAWAILDTWKPEDRASLTGYDCSTGKWVTILFNDSRKRGAGASIGYIHELAAGMTLENFMVEWSQDEYRGQSLTHVCLFQIHVYPRERAAQVALTRRRR